MTEIRDDVLTDKDFTMLRRLCGMAPLDPQRIHKAIEGSLFTLSCYQQGSLCGMTRIVGDGTFIFLLCDLLVIPSHRRKGLGTMLVQTAIRRLESRLPPDAWAPLSLFAATEKEAFYKKLGFVSAPNKMSGAGMQKYIQGNR